MSEASRIVKARLAEIKKSQADVARALDVSTSTISRWISGEMRPSQDQWERMTDYLDLSETLPYPPAGARPESTDDVSDVIAAVRFARRRVSDIDLDAADHQSVLIQVEDLLAQLNQGPMETLDLTPEND